MAIPASRSTRTNPECDDSFWPLLAEAILADIQDDILIAQLKAEVIVCGEDELDNAETE